MHQVTFRRIATGSIYKLIFFGSWIGSLPIFIALGLMATFGIEIISWNGSYMTGPRALLGGPLLGLFMATLFGAFVGTMTALGLWIFSKFRELQLYCDFSDSKNSADIDA